MKKSLCIILLLCLAGCFSSQPRMTLSDKMNLIYMDDTLTTDEKMLRLKMLEMEVVDQERQRARRAEALTGLGEAFKSMGQMPQSTIIHTPPVYRTPKNTHITGTSSTYGNTTYYNFTGN